MTSTAPASGGKPKWYASSTAAKMPWSISSIAAGTMPAAMIWLTALPASSSELKTARIAR